MKKKDIECQICKCRFKIEKEDKEKWENNKLICPLCKGTYCVMPESERKLMTIQDKFIAENRNEKYLTEMYPILCPYAESLIKKHYSQAINSTEELQYSAQYTVSFVIENYVRKTDFFIRSSFGSYMLHRIRQVLYGKPEQLIEDVSINYEFEDDNAPSYEDKTYNYIEKIEENENKRLLCSHLLGLLFGIEEYCANPLDDYMRLIALDIYFTKGENAVSTFFKSFGYHGKMAYSDSIDILYKELRAGSSIVGS